MLCITDTCEREKDQNVERKRQYLLFRSVDWSSYGKRRNMINNIEISIYYFVEAFFLKFNEHLFDLKYIFNKWVYKCKSTIIENDWSAIQNGLSEKRHTFNNKFRSFYN